MSARVALLGDVARVVDCEHRTAPRADATESFGYSIGTSNVRGGRISLDAAKPVTLATFESWTRRAVPQPGDLIFSREAPMGEVGEVPSGVHVCLGQRTVLLQLRHDLVNQRYLKHSLMSPGAQRWISDNSAGTTVLHLNVADVRRIPLGVLPSLEDQRRVVDLLEDHLSRLDAANRALLAAARRTQAAERAALDVFTAAPTGLVPLGALVDRVEAGKSFGSAGRAAGAGEWAIIRVSAMTWGSFRPEENKAVSDVSRVDPRYEIKSGDLLVSRANTSEYVGASVLVRETRARLLLSDKSLRVVPMAGVEPAFLHAALRAPRTRAQISALATGTKDSMRNISQAALLKVMVPNLPGDAQVKAIDKIESLGASLEHIRSELADAVARSGALRRSLLSAAFAGRLSPSRVEDLEMARV